MAASSGEILEIYNRQFRTVYRVCYSFMKNAPEAEDMVQETFLKLLSCGKQFESQRHERAWLIVTASNTCKDQLRKWWRNSESIDDCALASSEIQPPENTVLSAILALPKDYKTAVYMFYYEGYSTAEIARFSGCRESTVRSRLSRARHQLQTILEGEDL